MATTGLIVRNARVHPSQGRPVDPSDVLVEGDRIAAIRPAGTIPADGRLELDADGRLLSPPLVDPHVHLDAVLTVGQPRHNESGTLIELRDELRDFVELQLIAFPQDGVLSFPNGKELMREAMRLGCDVIGGIPHYEWTRDDGVEEVHFLFDLAKETGAPIDLHCDETDDEQSRFLEVVAARTMRDGMGGRVVAGHTTAMGSYNDAYAFKLLQILKRAGVTIVANPLDNIVLQGRFDTYPKRRGMTRVKELDAAGVNVACGHDSIMDPWYPLGRGSMLDAISMLVHVAQMTGRGELFRAWEMVTMNPARAAEVPWGIREGLPANFVVFDCADESEAIRLRPAARWVVRNGRIVAETEPARSTVHVAGVAQPVTYRRDPVGTAGAGAPAVMVGAGRSPAQSVEGVDG